MLTLDGSHLFLFPLAWTVFKSVECDFYILKPESANVMTSGGRMCCASRITFHDDVGARISEFHLSMHAVVGAPLEPTKLCFAK